MKKILFGRVICLMISIVMMFSSFTVLSAAAEEQKSETASTFEIDKDVLAYAVLGEEPETKGMNVWMGDTNKPTTLLESGKTAWNLDPSQGAASRYIYVDIDDDLVQFNSDGRNLEVTVEYFDKGKGSLVLEYCDLDMKNPNFSQRNYNTKAKTVEYKEHSILDFTDTKTWKQHTWFIQHPSLQNEMNKADFRFGIYIESMGYSKEAVLVSSVSVRETHQCGQIGIDVKSGNLGNIFFTGETMDFDVIFDNGINPVFAKKNGNYTADVTYTITDSRGKDVFCDKRNIKIRPNAKITDHISFKPDRYDLYTLKIEAESKEKAVYSFDVVKCAYSWTTHGEIKNPRAGISISAIASDEFNAEGIAKLIRNAGYTYVRHHFGIVYFGSSSYNNIEPNEWAQHQGYTEYMAALAKYGLAQVGYVAPNARPNAAPKANLEVDKSAVPKTERGFQNFVNYNKSTLDIFWKTLNAFGMWNEVEFMQPIGEDRNVNAQGKAIVRTAPLLKEEYPDMTIIGPDTAYVDEPWLRDFFETGAQKYLDKIAIHMYSHEPVPPSKVAIKGEDPKRDIVALRKLMEEFNITDKEIWLTEYGHSAYWNAANEYQQACWDLMYYCIYSAQNQADKLFRFQFYDAIGKNRTDKERNFGIIHSETYGIEDRCSAKPGYLSQSAMNILMSDAQQLERVELEEGLCYRYNKKDSGKQMLVIGGDYEGESHTASFDLGVNEVTVYDWYGNTKTLNSTNGTYSFAVEMEPFYVVGDFKKFEKVENSVVYPESTFYQEMYNDTVIIPFSNGTGMDLTAKISLMPGSEIEAEETVSISKNSSISLKLGASAPKSIEPVHITVIDADGKFYFDDEIYIKYANPITFDTGIKINQNKEWSFITTISNSSSKKAYTGTLQLVAPSDWINKVEKKLITVNPGETLTVEQKIIARDETSTRLTASLAFIPTEENSDIALYKNKVFDFAYAPKAQNIAIDADLSEWKDGWMYLNSVEQFEAVLIQSNSFFGVDDLWARVATRWDDENFYFAGEVHDDVFYAEGVNAANMWSVDDFQIGVVYGDEGSDNPKKFEELSFALLEGTPTIYRHLTRFTDLEDVSKVEGAELAIVNKGSVTYYELKVPWSSLIPGFVENNIKIEAGNEIRIGILLNENDGMGRKGYYKLGDGIGSSKNSNLFTELFMTE